MKSKTLVILIITTFLSNCNNAVGVNNDKCEVKVNFYQSKSSYGIVEFLGAIAYDENDNVISNLVPVPELNPNILNIEKNTTVCIKYAYKRIVKSTNEITIYKSSKTVNIAQDTSISISCSP